MELPMVVKVFMSLAFLAVFGLFIRLYDGLVKNPKRVRSILSKQGIDGPLPTFLLGNVWKMKKAMSRKGKAPAKKAPVYHSCADAIFPFLNQWRSKPIWYTPFHYHYRSPARSLQKSSTWAMNI